MRILPFVASVVAFANTALGQFNAVRYCDPSTQICYSSFSFQGISYRVSLPQTTTSSDAIIQIIAPNTFGWVGFSWGGQMRNSPLTVTWRNGNNVVVSSRRATTWSLPGPYPLATYTPLRGTGTNGTHWTLTARCQGCTQWIGQNNQQFNIHNSDSTQFAFAYSTQAPFQPANNASSFSYHNSYGFWQHDLTAAKNAQYESYWRNNAL